MKKAYEHTVTFHGKIVAMNGEGIEKIIKGRWEEITIEEFIEDFQGSAVNQGLEQVYDFSFYFDYESFCVDYDPDIVSDNSVDAMNDFIFNSKIRFTR